MIRSEKTKYLERIKSLFQEKKVAILFDYRGLKVGDITTLRTGIKKAGGDMMVVKNTLLRKVIEKTPMESLIPYIRGPVAVTVSVEDPIEISKTITAFSKNVPLPIKAGFYNGRILGDREIVQFSRLPVREVLNQNLLSILYSPLYQMVNLLKTPSINLLSLLEAYRREREK